MSKQYLVIDNGSYNIKAGFKTEDESHPVKVPNIISKTKDGLIHIGDQYEKHTNNYSQIQFKSPFEQGHLTSWETEKPIWDYTFDLISNKEIDTSSTQLILTETPFQLPQLSINTDQIVFEEYGFDEYYRCPPGALIPFSIDSQVVNFDFNLIIDSGFDHTWIIPMIYQNIYWPGVKKLPIGGKILNNLLKEFVNFRHYDISDDPILINTIKESTCFMATDFNQTLKDKLKHGCEFVLPDFKITTTGFVKTDDSVSLDAQIIKLYDERFIVPETFYHPEIIFDNNSATSSIQLVKSAPFKNLVDLVKESIYACPEITRPLLSANICLVGGTTNLPNFQTRLNSELKKELPSNWKVRIFDKYHVPKDEMSWLGGINLSDEEVLKDITISKNEYFEHGSNWCQKQFGFKNTSI